MWPFSGRSTVQARFEALGDHERRLIERAASGSIAQREAALSEALAAREQNQDLFFPVASGNREVIDFARAQVIPQVENGMLTAARGLPFIPGPHRTEMVTAENHPELYRQTLEMNRQLNERHGTRYPPPDVMIVDNDNHVSVYSRSADMIVISRRTLEQGNAPAMIAHELAERQGSLIRGDLRNYQEITLQERLGLAQSPGPLERHRANECREDADAIALVGPDAYQHATYSLFNQMPQSRHDTSQLNDISAGLSRGGAADHYPTTLDRHRMAATFRDNPELLERFRNNPQAIQLDGACNITEVEARGAGTARAAQHGSNDPTPAR